MGHVAALGQEGGSPSKLTGRELLEVKIVRGDPLTFDKHARHLWTGLGVVSYVINIIRAPGTHT